MTLAFCNINESKLITIVNWEHGRGEFIRILAQNKKEGEENYISITKYTKKITSILLLVSHPIFNNFRNIKQQKKDGFNHSKQNSNNIFR